LSYSP